MNAQQQDIIRLLTSRGPMTSRALFDIMQDELGYWSQASSHDQQSIAVEALSKILSKMKSENLIHGSMTAQPKGRPVMVWSAPNTDKSDGEIYAESSARHAPKELHDIAQSAIGNLTSPGYIPDDDPENDFGMMPETPAIPDDEHSEMESDIADVLQPPKPLPMEFMGTQMIVKSGYVNDPGFMYMNATESGVVIHGRVAIRNRAELAQFIGAIERMLP